MHSRCEFNFFPEEEGALAYAYWPPTHKSYVVWSIIINSFLIYRWEIQKLLIKGLKLTIMLWNMPLLIDASVNLDLFVQCPSQRCEGAQQYRAWLNLLTRTTSALSNKPMWDWTRVFDDRSWFEIYLNYMLRV